MMLADPFLTLKDARGKRYVVASTGAGMLIAGAAVVERFAAF
jgi:hypothetical protein